jgi:hypothetical protein
MNSDDARDKAPPEGAPPEPHGEPHEGKPRDYYERLHAEYHRTEANAAKSLVLITLFASLIGLATLVAIFFQTKATGKSADAAATAASVAAETLRESKTQATAQSTAVAQQLHKMGENIQAQLKVANGTLRVASATEDNAIAARKGLKEAEKTLSVSQANFAAQQRPYLAVSIPNLAADSTSYMFVAQLEIGNYGRSAARNILIAYNVSHSDHGEAASQAADTFFKSPQASWGGWSPVAPLPPGVNAPPSTSEWPRWGPYPRDTFLRLVKTWDGIAIYGRIKYQDSLKHPHRFYTDFCLFRVPSPSTAIGQCPRHNYLE